jgi:hypothetical protein
LSWDTKLPEPIALKSGRGRFQTLGDAARFLQRRYSKARSGALAGAIEDLIAAADDPSADNLTRATDQLSTFLAQEGLIEPQSRKSAGGTDIHARMRAMLEGRPLSPAAKAVRAKKPRP